MSISTTMRRGNMSILHSTGRWYGVFVIGLASAALQIKKPPHGGFCFRYLRGFEQIRTAVGAFAELCLATRPRNHLPRIFGQVQK
jgi:hypothetical protein